MSQFHFSKIIATVGPSLAKETILSKVINFVDMFRINLSHGFDDSKKKYIDTILKLDNSKTILLETKGQEIRTRNAIKLTLRKGETIAIEFSDYEDEKKGTLFMDYPNFLEIPTGTEISFEDCDVTIKTLKSDGDKLSAKVTSGGSIMQSRKIKFKNYKPDLPFITERDKKDMLRGIQSGVNVVVASYVKDENNLLELKEFLSLNNGKNVKIISKIETKEAIENIEQIINSSDGILLPEGILKTLDIKKGSIEEEEIINMSNKYGKPVIIAMTFVGKIKGKKKANIDTVKKYLHYGVDSFMLTSETSIGDDPLESISGLYDAIVKNQFNIATDFKLLDIYKKDNDSQITDYVVYNAYRMTKEFNVRAIICYTSNGYMPCRLSTLKPNIPIIVFTKAVDTYKYLNLLWAVKGYKISNTFTYENIKKIGKEMIRIMFKGNISLDDKIIIMHSSDLEELYDNRSINGIEIYKFKDI